MNRTLTLPSCLLILAILHPALTYADTQSPSPDSGQPSFIGPVEGRVHVSPAIQLPVNAEPPIACSADTRGTIALNTTVQLCLCDGAGWKLINSDTSCTWKTAP